MATGVKEVQLKEKGISAPSTRRRILLSHGGQTTPNGDISMAKEKPTPNYLKPTICSCHDTSCSYPKSQQQQQQQQHAEDSTAAAGARKRLISVKSMEKPASPSSLDKTHKRRASRTDLSPKAALSPKILPDKASNAPTFGKTLAKAKSFPKRREANGSTPSTTSAIKPEQEEKVLFIDTGVHGHAARQGSQAPKRNTEGKRRTSSEESDTGKPRAPPGKVLKKVCGNEGAPKKLKSQRGREREGDDQKEAVGKRLKFKQREKVVEVAGEGKGEQENVVLKRQEVKEKDALPAYNDVIEETAAKLATRGNKVRALVGAFESVISLQEPEAQPSQRPQVAAAKIESGQPAQLKPEEDEVNIGEEGAERGQPALPEKEIHVAGVEGCGRGQTGQQQLEEEKGEKESGEEETKGRQSVQESPQKETEEEEENGGEESKGGQLDQEIQPKETLARESEEDEGDGVEEDGSNVTKE